MQTDTTGVTNEEVLNPELRTALGTDALNNTLAGNINDAISGTSSTILPTSTPPSDAINYHQPLQETLATPSQITGVTNNTPTITAGYDAALTSTITAIKAAIAQAKAAEQKRLTDAQPQYDKLKNAAYGQTLAAVPVLRENLANMGTSQQSGYSKSQELALNTDLRNRLNELNIEQQRLVNDANFQISQLESQGLMQEAQATAENANQKLQAIIQEQNRIDEVSRGNEQFEYQKERDVIADERYGQQFAVSEEQRAFENAMTGDQFEFQKEQAKIQNQLQQGTFDMQKQSQTWEQAYKSGTFDYQKARDLVSDERYSGEWKQALDEWAYQKEQDRINNQLQQGQFDLAREAQDWEQKWQSGMFDYQKERDLVSDNRYVSEWAQQLNEFAYQKEQNRIQNELAQGQFNMAKEAQAWEQRYQEGMFNYQKERDLVGDNRYASEWTQQLQEFTFQKQQAANQLKLQEAQLTGTYNDKPTLEAMIQENNRKIQEAELTGKYNDVETLQSQQLKIENAMKEADLTGKYKDADTIYAEQLKIDNSMKEAQLTGTYKDKSTLEMMQYTTQKALQEAELTGTYNNKETLQKQLADIEVAMKEADLTGSYKGYDTLQKKQIDIENAMAEAQFKMQESQLTGTYNGQETSEAKRLREQWEWQTAGADKNPAIQAQILENQINEALLNADPNAEAAEKEEIEIEGLLKWAQDKDLNGTAKAAFIYVSGLSDAAKTALAKRWSITDEYNAYKEMSATEQAEAEETAGLLSGVVTNVGKALQIATGFANKLNK